jgi:hypothetical protein
MAFANGCPANAKQKGTVAAGHEEAEGGHPTPLAPLPVEAQSRAPALHDRLPEQRGSTSNAPSRNTTSPSAQLADQRPARAALARLRRFRGRCGSPRSRAARCTSAAAVPLLLDLERPLVRVLADRHLGLRRCALRAKALSIPKQTIQSRAQAKSARYGGELLCAPTAEGNR